MTERTSRPAALLLLSLLAAVFFSGCEKKAGLEGRVTDGSGQPIPHVKVTALQDKPVSGYSHFETETDAQGMFSFRRLFPQADYTLVINSDSTGLRQVKLKSGNNGQTVTLPSPIVFRFIVSPDTIVTDTRSGFQWAPDPNIAMDWNQARKYVRSLKLGGFSDWRLPTRAEIRSLDGIDSSFPLNDCCVWTAEAVDKRRAWYFNLYRFFEEAAYVNSRSYRVLAVRIPAR
jgi:hypothetical protein